MSLAFRSAATAADGAAPVSLTVSKPTGVVNGDVLVAFVVISADKSIAAAPAGWTLLDSRSTGTATGDCLHAVYYKTASSEGSTYVWDFSGGADAAAAILAYSGVSTSASINVSGSRLMSSSSTTHTTPSVTTSSDDTVTISAYGTNPVFNGDLTFTTPSGLTSRAEADPGAGTTNRAVLKVFDKTTSSAGATGDKSSTINNSAKGVGFTVSLSPLVAAPLALTVQPYRVAPTATGCMIGWHEDGAYSTIESLLETKFAAVRIYNEWWPAVSGQVQSSLDDGRLPVVSHKPPKHANAWIEIARGDHDADITAMVAYYKGLAPKDILFIFHHEPHKGASDAGNKSPVYGRQSDFVAAFRRIAKAFNDANADNVHMGYCAIDSHADDYPNDLCYPGHDAVDVLCHDVYNWGGYPGFSAWKDPSTLFPPFVAIAKAVNKPWVMGEVGCHPDASPHDRGQWLRDFAAYLKTGDAATYVAGFCYYHVDSHNGSGHYWRFAQGTTADGRQDFIDTFSQDSHFLTTPLIPSLTQTTAPPPTNPDDGTPPSVSGVVWARKSTVGGIPANYGEVSGLAASPKGGLWAIRDSGNPAALNWLTQTSRGNFAIHDVTVTGATNGDWEDCFYSIEAGTAYIYIHDNRDGNSTGALPRRLYKVAEPATPSATSSVALTATYYWSFPGSASSSTCGSQQNCEAMAIFKGIIYAVQKTDASEAEVYRLGAPGSLSTNSASPTMGVKVGTIAHHCPSAFAISADGTSVITVAHGSTNVWRGRGDNIASLLTGKNHLVFSDSPGGSGEGADWWPYQSSDFVVASEDRDTFDYDVSVGVVRTSGIASTAGFGEPLVTLDGGPILITSAGSISAPGDYEDPEGSPGLDFGTLVATFSSSPTPGLEGSFFFEPPTVDDVPPVPSDWLPIPALPGGRPERRLFAHFKNRARGRTVILLKTGAAFATDYPTQMVPAWQDQGDPFTESGLAGYPYSQIARVFLGGHIDIVDADEATLLTAAGFGAGLTPVPEPPPANLRWGALAGGTWADFATNYSTWGG